MITPAYVATMARYNAWQNRSLYAAADGLSDAARREDRGAFFGSIHGTLSHLLWADILWMSRFDGWETIEAGISESAGWVASWDDLCARRQEADARILAWAGAISQDRLDGDLSFFSRVLGRQATKPLDFCVVHFFNHQTHHRGQVHAMLTAAGVKPEDTDLFVMPEGAGELPR